MSIEVSCKRGSAVFFRWSGYRSSTHADCVSPSVGYACKKAPRTHSASAKPIALLLKVQTEMQQPVWNAIAIYVELMGTWDRMLSFLPRRSPHQHISLTIFLLGCDPILLSYCVVPYPEFLRALSLLRWFEVCYKM